jgi:predicted N-acyltransferase
MKDPRLGLAVETYLPEEDAAVRREIAMLDGEGPFKRE